MDRSHKHKSFVPPDQTAWGKLEDMVQHRAATKPCAKKNGREDRRAVEPAVIFSSAGCQSTANLFD